MNGPTHYYAGRCRHCYALRSVVADGTDRERVIGFVRDMTKQGLIVRRVSVGVTVTFEDHAPACPKAEHAEAA